MSPRPTLDELPVSDLFAASMQSRTVEIALRIGLIEALQAPETQDEFRATLGIAARALEVLLSVLAASVLIDLSQPAQEALLCPANPFSGKPVLQGWPHPLDARSGAADSFATSTSRMERRALPPRNGSPAPSVRRMLDVAGGAGTNGIALAIHNHALRRTMLDLPGMESAASALVREHGVFDRVSFVGANMFRNAWPSGHDAILLITYCTTEDRLEHWSLRGRRLPYCRLAAGST